MEDYPEFEDDFMSIFEPLIERYNLNVVSDDGAALLKGKRIKVSFYSNHPWPGFAMSAWDAETNIWIAPYIQQYLNVTDEKVEAFFNRHGKRIVNYDGDKRVAAQAELSNIKEVWEHFYYPLFEDNFDWIKFNEFIKAQAD